MQITTIHCCYHSNNLVYFELTHCIASLGPVCQAAPKQSPSGRRVFSSCMSADNDVSHPVWYKIRGLQHNIRLLHRQMHRLDPTDFGTHEGQIIVVRSLAIAEKAVSIRISNFQWPTCHPFSYQMDSEVVGTLGTIHFSVP